LAGSMQKVSDKLLEFFEVLKIAFVKYAFFP
jgi:hypothetical protein